ncbi:transmembrane protein 14C-like [Canis lupus familiaris]|uniref:transmembrane protein 14C-like n=1 Tax=Canis lupus familiaris TaxID=9615 RepID=UPI0018F64C59|nr:transmembrane protein 14C-like [Canis lupus familiaris]
MPQSAEALQPFTKIGLWFAVSFPSGRRAAVRCRPHTLLSGQSEGERCRRTGPLVPIHWIGFGYAALVASGGIIGYAKAGSVPSLAAGLFFGSLAGLGAYQLSQDPRNIWVFLATSGTLAGIMGMRFYHSGKFMPAGLIAGASLLMVAKLGISVLNKPHQ